MKCLWAPWRMEYIRQEKTGDCIFCSLPRAGDDAQHYILRRDSLCFVIMNVFPYNCGHVMVSPFVHVNCITKLDRAQMDQMGALTQKCVEILSAAYAPDGFNIGLNLGKSAGAGYDEHIHTHIVPRWNGDTNFMPALGETKVHPEHLRTTYDRLAPLFQKIKL
ncbi:MAG: HIT domain-containing protein [Nitrospinae bacterium]|nr:HIT domain-containing protein [Nitrospinota bacterium]